MYTNTPPTHLPPSLPTPLDPQAVFVVACLLALLPVVFMVVRHVMDKRKHFMQQHMDEVRVALISSFIDVGGHRTTSAEDLALHEEQSVAKMHGKLQMRLKNMRQRRAAAAEQSDAPSDHKPGSAPDDSKAGPGKPGADATAVGVGVAVSTSNPLVGRVGPLQHDDDNDAVGAKAAEAIPEHVHAHEHAMVAEVWQEEGAQKRKERALSHGGVMKDLRKVYSQHEAQFKETFDIARTHLKIMVNFVQVRARARPHSSASVHARPPPLSHTYEAGGRFRCAGWAGSPPARQPRRAFCARSALGRC